MSVAPLAWSVIVTPTRLFSVRNDCSVRLNRIVGVAVIVTGIGRSEFGSRSPGFSDVLAITGATGSITTEVPELTALPASSVAVTVKS